MSYCNCLNRRQVHPEALSADLQTRRNLLIDSPGKFGDETFGRTDMPSPYALIVLPAKDS
jgi:hypothetical protein